MGTKTKKSIFSSKTFWLNLIMGALAILTLLDPTVLGAFGVAEAKQGDALKIVGVITAVLNIFLRLIFNTLDC